MKEPFNISKGKREFSVKGSKKKNRLMQFIINNVDTYILGDLSELEKIENKQFTCAIPTAMLIFSTLDFIGFLLKKKGSKLKTAENLREIFCNKKYFPKVYKDFIEILVKTYRHGIMHEFYPHNDENCMYAFHKSANHSELFYNSNLDGKEIVSLNVSVLADDFKNFLKTLKKEIKQSHEDSVLVSKMGDVLIGNFNMPNKNPQDFVVTSSNSIIRENK